jgi:hypothetical protein
MMSIKMSDISEIVERDTYLVERTGASEAKVREVP